LPSFFIALAFTVLCFNNW